MSQCRAISKRSGERCRKHSSKGLNVCSMHGGKSLRGVDSPRFKTGRHSRYLPANMVEKYEQALADEELMRLNDEIALVDALLQNQLEYLNQEGEEPVAWAQVMGLVEQRRKLVDTERKRLLDEDQVITIERLMILVAAVADIVQRNVASREERAAVANELRLLVSGADGPR